MDRVGHVWRDGENLKKNVLIKTHNKKKHPRGRSCLRWIDQTKKDICDTDESKSLDDAIDRNAWRSLMKACKRP